VTDAQNRYGLSRNEKMSGFDKYCAWQCCPLTVVGLRRTQRRFGRPISTVTRRWKGRKANRPCCQDLNSSDVMGDIPCSDPDLFLSEVSKQK
jgi:hypothetical protein